LEENVGATGGLGCVSTPEMTLSVVHAINHIF